MPSEDNTKLKTINSENLSFTRATKARPKRFIEVFKSPTQDDLYFGSQIYKVAGKPGVLEVFCSQRRCINKIRMKKRSLVVLNRNKFSLRNLKDFKKRLLTEMQHYKMQV